MHSAEYNWRENMTTFTTYLNKNIISAFSTWHWWLLAILSVIVSQLTMGWLNGLYAATQFPVSIYEGQTTFNGVTIKGYYATLQALGTFNDYVWVQIADYAFMVTVFISMACCTIALYRSLPQVRFLKTLGYAMIFIAPMAAVSDALENLVSFAMLVNPEDFANWLAIPYSSFAVTKFAIFTLSYLWAALAGLICLVHISLCKLKIIKGISA